MAIKKITNVFDNHVDSKRTFREIRLLRHMAHENVIAIRDIIPPTSAHAFRDVFIVYDLMDTDLHQIIKSGQSLSDDHCQYFIYQVSRGGGSRAAGQAGWWWWWWRGAAAANTV